MKKFFGKKKNFSRDYEQDWDDLQEYDLTEEGDGYYAEEAGDYVEEGDGYYAETGEAGDYVEEDGYYAEAEETGDYVEEDGYYAEAEETGDYVEEDGYYAETEEAGDYVEEDGYYAEAEEAGDYVEEGDGYYAEEEAGDYAEEDGYYAEEDGYYAETEDPYYAADEYQSEDDFEEDIYYIEDDANYAEPTGNPFRKLWYKIAAMNRGDRVILCTGIVVVFLTLITGVVFAGSRITDKQVEAFATAGSQLDGIEVIGEAGLNSVAEAWIARNQAEQVTEPEIEKPKEYDEQEYANAVTVALKMTSIKKDLKIKITNKKTGKLIPSVPFEVEVTNPKGKVSTWEDEDQDGILYKTDLTPGEYVVSLKEIAGNEKYQISTVGQNIKVKEKLDYEKVDVSDEIKTEAEVDASKEDTAKNDVEEESRLQDTVAWVESTKTPVGETYVEVGKSEISKPSQKSARAGMNSSLTGIAATGLSPAEISAKEQNVVVSLSTVAPFSGINGETVSIEGGNSLGVGQSITLGTRLDNFPGGATYSYVWSVSDSSVASLSSTTDPSVTLTASKNLTAEKKITVGVTVTASVTEQDATGNEQRVVEYSASATKEITITAVPLTISQKEMNLQVGESATLIAKQGEDTSGFQWSSSDASIATVDQKGVVKAVGAGKTTITATKGNASVSCSVKVTAAPEVTDTTPLKDKKGNQVYILKSNGQYVEATAADYEKASKFFIKQQGYKYTGWQTIDGKVYYYDVNGNKVTGTQVIQGVQYNFGSDGALVSSNGTLGIDVSKWNGSIDWKAVKNSGVSYVIIRCGYRGSSQGALIEDPKFKANIQGATAAGLKVGVYFFTQAVNEVEAVEEASMVLSLIKGYKLSYPVFLDVEASGGRADAISKDTRTAVCRAFCQTIQNSGYTAGVYANKTWFSSYIDAGALSAYRIWLAQYAATPTYGGRYDIWQYTSKGQISGISGNVDMNLSYMGY